MKHIYDHHYGYVHVSDSVVAVNTPEMRTQVLLKLAKLEKQCATPKYLDDSFMV